MKKVFRSEKMFLIHTSECSLNKTRLEMLILITFYIDEFKNWYCRVSLISRPQIGHTIVDD